MAGEGTTLKSAGFRREREKVWTELERLVDRIERRGIQTLSADELARLPKLYRATLSSLSVARTISLDKALLEYLQALSARAYFCVYASKQSARSMIGEFFADTFPTLLRKHGWFMLVAGLFMLCGVVTGFLVFQQDPGTYELFVAAEQSQGRDPGASTESLRSVLYSGGDQGDDGLSAFAAFLFQHNMRVGLLCFALGFLLGVPVFVIQFTNGAGLGAMAGLYHSRGLSVEFWSWILPHGVTELLAIIVCGGAGLILGHGVMVPGRFSRIENLKRVGREAGAIAAGTVVLFLAAGLLEGFFRQMVRSVPVRYVVALATLGFWIVYLGFAGRGSRGTRAQAVVTDPLAADLDVEEEELL
ncbi:MAG: stage II sporulation protein M [Planctomycetota bacterium]|jgi:uncharacterized membrane protein SpoIIM required for sporulation